MKILTDHKARHREYLAVYGLHSAPPARCTLSFRVYASLVLGALFFVLSSPIGCSRIISPSAKSQTFSPVELFRKVSPSVFIVQSLDENGRALMLGSGVALARDFVITNCHVVQSAASLKISHGKENWSARLIQAAPSHDLCGLRPSGRTLQVVDIRPSSKLVTGEHVYAIGSPEGLELTFSEGVISALRDTEGVRMVQTSAAISPGSSGGGLFDTQGNLVGITTFYLKEGQSLNFALPGEWVKTLLDSLSEASRKSSPPRSNVELESTAWLQVGQEAVKNEDYDLAVHSFHKSADLKEGDAFRSWLELGKLWARGSARYSPEVSAKYEAWLCAAVRCHGFMAEPDIRAARDQAIAAFQSAIELKPENADAWIGLANLYGDQKQYDQAVSYAKEATRLAPGDFRGWTALGLYYTDTKSYAEAKDALQQAERVVPSDKKTGVMVLAGILYATMKDREQVMRIYQELKGRDAKAADRFFREYVLPSRPTH